jgi:hypothetical protein
MANVRVTDQAETANLTVKDRRDNRMAVGRPGAPRPKAGTSALGIQAGLAFSRQMQAPSKKLSLAQGIMLPSVASP